LNCTSIAVLFREKMVLFTYVVVPIVARA
jgi:hypothetical protein